jgi:putative acetyltransferase
MTATTGASPALRDASGRNDIELARALFIEYAQWLRVDLCFQGFDRELATLPGAYAPPYGRLLLAGLPGEAFGCAALRPLAAAKDAGSGGASEAHDGIGEVKRLYVRPGNRNGGWGRQLAESIVAKARTIGYRELKLDTLEWMSDARRLYEKLGFRECARYYDNPLPGVVYMALTL